MVLKQLNGGKAMNLPNKLTMLRIIMIPFFVFFLLSNIPGKDIIALVLFCAASLTDLADGKIARKYNLVTDFGKFMDPLADKILVISVMIAFVELRRFSAWLLIIVILREFAISGIRMIAASKNDVIAARMIGKVKTATQVVAISYLMFEPLLLKIFGFGFTGYANLQINAITIIGDVLLGISMVMVVVSGVDYIIKGKKYLKG